MCYNYRSVLKNIGRDTKVEIEPDLVTVLLNYLMEDENIVYGISPGAGGYDSICIICLNTYTKEQLYTKLNNFRELAFSNFE